MSVIMFTLYVQCWGLYCFVCAIKSKPKILKPVDINLENSLNNRMNYWEYPMLGTQICACNRRQVYTQTEPKASVLSLLDGLCASAA